MNILFVYRGYGATGANSVIDFQRESLIKAGIHIDNFFIKGGGVKNYLVAILELRRFLKKHPVDLLHAHYSFSGYIAGLAATRKPVVCSLMGTDVLKSHQLLGKITKLFYKFVWKATIVKSAEMQQLFPKAFLIPNGVDFENFKSIPQKDALIKAGFTASNRNVIFVAEAPETPVKNIKLARAAIALLDNERVKLHAISGKSFTELPYYFNAADALLLTSISEGSPNVIKEAMACNCPIVATDVGDIRKVLGNIEGCFITTFDERDVAAKLKQALAFNSRTKGREIIQHLDSKVVAEKLVGVYKNLINKK